MAWPQPPRGGKSMIGNGSNPLQSGMLNVLEHIGEAARVPVPSANSATGSGRITVFTARFTVDGEGAHLDELERATEGEVTSGGGTWGAFVHPIPDGWWDVDCVWQAFGAPGDVVEVTAAGPAWSSSGPAGGYGQIVVGAGGEGSTGTHFQGPITDADGFGFSATGFAVGFAVGRLITKLG